MRHRRAPPPAARAVGAPQPNRAVRRSGSQTGYASGEMRVCRPARAADAEPPVERRVPRLQVRDAAQPAPVSGDWSVTGRLGRIRKVRSALAEEPSQPRQTSHRREVTHQRHPAAATPVERQHPDHAVHPRARRDVGSIETQRRHRGHDPGVRASRRERAPARASPVPRPDHAVAVAGENRLWGFRGDGVDAAAMAAERRRGFPRSRSYVP